MSFSLCCPRASSLCLEYKIIGLRTKSGSSCHCILSITHISVLKGLHRATERNWTELNWTEMPVRLLHGLFKANEPVVQFISVQVLSFHFVRSVFALMCANASFWHLTSIVNDIYASILPATILISESPTHELMSAILYCVDEHERWQVFDRLRPHVSYNYIFHFNN